MNSATRGVILAVFAVLLGVIILGRGFDDPTVATGDASPTAVPSDDGGSDVAEDDGSTPADDTTDTGADDGTTDAADTPAGDDATEPPATDGTVDGATDGSTDGTGGEGQVKPPAEVRVLVANDTTVGGLAGTVTNQLTAEGYATLTPTNSTTQGADAAAPSVVYFANGYRPDAVAVATLLNLPETSVAQLPEAPPVADLGRANLLVIVGADLVPAA